MGRRSSHSPAEVKAAIDALYNETGVIPEVGEIRARLGDEGSRGTIHRIREEWKLEKFGNPAAAMTLPAEVSQAIFAFVGVEVAAARVAMDAELVALQKTTASIATEAEHTTKIVKEQAEQLAQLAAGKAAVEGRAGQLLADLAKANEAAETERKAAEAVRLDIATASLSLETARAELESERQARSAAEHRVTVLDVKNAELHSHLTDAKLDSARAHERFSNAKADARRDREAADAARAELAKAEQRATDLTAQLNDTKQDTARAHDLLTAAQDSAEKLESSLNARIADLLGQIAEFKKDFERARASADSDRDEITLLRSKLDELRAPEARSGLIGHNGDETSTPL